MMKKNYLKDFTHYLQKQLSKQIVDKIIIHPGKSGIPPIQTMRNDANDKASNAVDDTSVGAIAHIYTLINESMETEIIETEQNDINLQAIAYLAVLNDTNNDPRIRLNKLYTLLENLIGVLNNQRWEMSYTFPAAEITAMDLYGLSYDSDKLVTSEGWDPTIQAYAKALYQTNQEELYPKNLTLWFVSWKQKLRV